MTNLEYTVDKVGNIVKCRTLEGESYQLVGIRVAEMPKSRLYRQDRWAALKRAASTQDVNVIIRYSGFKNQEELKRARNVLGRYKDDNFLKASLNGHSLLLSVDNVDLALYVTKVNNEDK